MSPHPDGDRPGPVDVGRLLDDGPWTGYQRWLVMLAALTIIFDGIDNQLLGIAIPSLLAEWNVPRSAFSPVVSLGFVGMMIGGATAGLAGDRFGRRSALLGSVTLFGAATLAVVAVEGIASLAALRLIAGIGLGGAIPNAATLAAEYVPARRRPFAVTLTIVCVPLGGTLAGLIAVPALPAIGWRGLFALGGVAPLLAVVALARVLPESPHYLARHPARWPELRRVLARMRRPVLADAAFSLPGATPAPRPRLADLFAPSFAGDTVALWAAFVSCLLAVYLGLSWLPTIITASGRSSAVASTGIMLFNLGGVAGAIGGAAVIGRFGSRATMLTMAALAAGGAAMLAATPLTPGAPLLPLYLLLTLTGGLINAVQDHDVCAGGARLPGVHPRDRRRRRGVDRPARRDPQRLRGTVAAGPRRHAVILRRHGGGRRRRVRRARGGSQAPSRTCVVLRAECYVLTC